MMRTSSKGRDSARKGKTVVESSGDPTKKKSKQKKDPRKELKARVKALLGVKLIKEMGINLAKLGHKVIPAKVTTLGWEQFVAQPININKTWVAEFYALASPDELGQGVPIRGRQVVITPTRVNDYLGIGGLELMSPWDFGF